MRGKRELVARIGVSLGLTKLLERLPQQNVLIILNYHRIGNAAETPFDSNVFSATAGEFSRQIAYLKRRFHIATLEEALAMVNGGAATGASLLITFDDGYLDNYTLAYPVLRSHGVQGTFFLPTSFVGTTRLPWWDEIAYIVKTSRHRQIRLAYPEPAVFDLDADGAIRVCMDVLRLFRQPSVTDTSRFMADLEEACGTSRPGGHTERRFLNWDEAREMQEHGMAFGSHTHNHEVLSKLPPDAQEEEARLSRQILERELGRTIDVMAYPVGQRECITPDTVTALKRTGYRAAFSYYGGVNQYGRIQPFDIHRFGMDGQSHSRLRLQTALAAVTGSRWF